MYLGLRLYMIDIYIVGYLLFFQNFLKLENYALE
jgi:hypothetical protein